MKIIDLSVILENDNPSDYKGTSPIIKPISHKDTVHMYPALTGGAVTIEDAPEGLGYADEEITAGGHSGTHVDAPWHYRPTMNKGEKAWTIDEVPIEWFVGPGVMIDFSDKPDGYLVKAKDFEEAFKKINYELKPGDIVLVHTSAAAKYGTDNIMTPAAEWEGKQPSG